MALKEFKMNHYCNPLIAHLNINSLRYKIIDLRELLDCADIEFLSLSDLEKRKHQIWGYSLVLLHSAKGKQNSFQLAKVDNSFPSAQFHTDNYFLFRRDRNKHGGGLAAFVKSRLLQKSIIK